MIDSPWRGWILTFFINTPNFRDACVADSYAGLFCYPAKIDLTFT
jgi:hypothetical protein